MELSAGNDADITGGNTSTWNPTNANNTTKVYVPIFKKIFCGASEVAEKETYSSSFQLNKPLVFNFGTKRKINKIRIPYGYFKDDNGIYTLYGRNSEEDKWNLITSFSGFEKVFNIVEYQYIQLTSDIANSLPYTANRPSYVNRVQNTICTTLDTVEKCKQNLCFLGYVGEGIKFVTPPSQESVITMSANTDIPFIGPNSVLDFQTTMTFKFK